MANRFEASDSRYKAHRVSQYVPSYCVAVDREIVKIGKICPIPNELG